MRATNEELTSLLQMQQIDLELIKTKKQLESLPQRATILAARQKKRTIEQKYNQVTVIREKAEAEAAKLATEDAGLAAKQRQVQEEINGARGDYRNVEARTKELNGFAKRRNTLEEELTKLSEELSKIEEIQNQASRALADIEKQENTAIVSFQKEGGALQNSIARNKAERGLLSESLSAEVREAYEQTASRSGGVAIGRLIEGQCSVCRVGIDGGRLIDLQTQAPLGVCPHCKRMLVVL